MSFPSANGTRGMTLAQAFANAQGIASQVKARASNLSTAVSIGPVAAITVLDFMNAMADAKTVLARVSVVPGLASFAQTQVGDATLNVANEFSSMVAAIDAVVNWVITNFPKDGSGYLLVVSFNVDNSGRTVQRQFSSAQTAGLKTVLDALVAAID